MFGSIYYIIIWNYIIIRIIGISNQYDFNHRILFGFIYRHYYFDFFFILTNIYIYILEIIPIIS